MTTNLDAKLFRAEALVGRDQPRLEGPRGIRYNGVEQQNVPQVVVEAAQVFVVDDATNDVGRAVLQHRDVLGRDDRSDAAGPADGVDELNRSIRETAGLVFDGQFNGRDVGQEPEVAQHGAALEFDALLVAVQVLVAVVFVVGWN